MTDEAAFDIKRNEFLQPETPETPETSAIENLRAFEDDVLGKDAVRIQGNIERGSGSWFQTKLTHEQRAHHAALVKLIETEQAVADARSALATAEAAHAQAEADAHG